MNIDIIGLDIIKTIFHLVALDNTGKQVLKKKLRRGQLLSYFANLSPCKISMEGCASSHYWARKLTKLGHKVKLLPAQHVKPFVRGNKNDYNDALAIAEASRITDMRAVEIMVYLVEKAFYICFYHIVISSCIQDLRQVFYRWMRPVLGR